MVDTHSWLSAKTSSDLVGTFQRPFSGSNGGCCNDRIRCLSYHHLPPQMGGFSTAFLEQLKFFH